MTDRKGLFVVFEGGDSVGKTTQLQLLEASLAASGVTHLITHEPGDTWLGLRIRHLVLDPDSGDIAPRAEALLYAADKAQHVTEVIEPALEQGVVVVCDRYVDSMLAYQGAGRVLNRDEVEKIARWATQDLRPDLTVLLDAAPHEAVATIESKDRIESQAHDFHVRVREHFLELAAADPERYLVLPALTSRSGLAAQVRERLEQLGVPKLSEPVAMLAAMEEKAARKRAATAEVDE